MMQPTKISPAYRFAGGPDAETLQRWVDDGLTDAEIGERMGQLTGQSPASRQAVRSWRLKHNIQRPVTRAPNLDHSAVRPWRVKGKHTSDAIEHRLYDFNRRRNGVQLAPWDEKNLDEFLAFLTRKQWVVDYDPDTEDGWLFRDRLPSDDPDNIIRKPA